MFCELSPTGPSKNLQYNATVYSINHSFGVMATVYDPEQRIHMLLVHGMLHLVGHDHEEDDEYELMVTEEDKKS
jgi:hypothetical protein